MDDVNNMDESMDKVDQNARRAGLDRRTMLKAAVAAGAIAGTWIAPRIESLGFAPAGAATVCPLTSEADLSSNNSGNTYVTLGYDNCGFSYGDASQGNPDFLSINVPGLNCTFTVQLVRRTARAPTSGQPAASKHQQPRCLGLRCGRDSSDSG